MGRRMPSIDRLAARTSKSLSYFEALLSREKNLGKGLTNGNRGRRLHNCSAKVSSSQSRPGGGIDLSKILREGEASLDASPILGIPQRSREELLFDN